MPHFRVCLSFVILMTLTAAHSQETRLLRSPAISDRHIAFVYANDIWIAGIDGNDARRLTTFTGAETEPKFSPDGRWIAFSGQYDGNTDVYIVSVNGGEPQRLTWHPGDDAVRTWTNDGQAVVFASGRTTGQLGYPQLFQVSVKGGLPQQLPIPRVNTGKFSPDGRSFVYQEIAPWESEWRNYRGGQNNPIRIITLQTLQVQKLPWDGSNDNTPVWLDDVIYFLSDRDYAMNVWSWDINKQTLKQETFFKEFDCKRLEAGDGHLIFENGGYIYLLNPPQEQPVKLAITVNGDFPWARPHWEKTGGSISSRALSPNGKRAVFEARGDIFTVPAKKGDVRNLTNSSASAEREPVWSPDGTQICWFSDSGGEYHLVIADQYGRHQKNIQLKDPTFFYSPVWSPDGKSISYTDANRDLWLLDVAAGRVRLIDNEGYAHPERTIFPAWSPDSKWIAYTKRLRNQYNAIFLYSLDKGKSFQLTDGLSDSKSPCWDKGGKYIYFLASTDYGLNVGWLDLSSLERPVNRAIYLAVLSAKEPSPLLPESDDEVKSDDQDKKEGEKDKKKDDAKEKDEGEQDKDDKDKEVVVTIDLDGLDQRILALNIPADDYSTLSAGSEGTIFYMRAPLKSETQKLFRYTLKERETKEIVKNLQDYTLSADGKKLLYTVGRNQWFIADADGEIKEGEGKLGTDDMQMVVDPQREWQQIFREAWRFQRDYFYVKNVHGLDLDWAFRTYAPWVQHARHRADLTYILDILGGETSIGHSFTGGGDWPDVETVPVGLLGVDFAVKDNLYQLARIYRGENWNPALRSPCSGPGIDIRDGDYLLSVNGVSLNAAMNPFSLFDRTADKQTVLLVNDKPDTAGARRVTVVPLSDDSELRTRAWIEDNRRLVDKLSDGKLAYVWLPNTSVSGYQNFNRYYFAQKDKKGAVIDERFNSGGLIADYVIDLLSRELLGYFNNPLGERDPFTAPNAAIWGPKVMIINESAGSGGDMMPYMFRLKKIGPLVGTKTWGGLVGIWDVPALVDGGYITAPRGGFYNLQGEWDVENIGVMPDVTVEQEPRLVQQGHDPQLEKAVEVALELLKTREVKIQPQPADPVRVRRPE